MDSYKKTIFFIPLIAVILQLCYGCATVEYKAPSAGTAPKKGLYHKVQPKETLWRIAKMYNVSMEDIIRSNNIPNVARIEKDQLIFIPGIEKTKESVSVKDDMKANDFDWPLKGDIVSYFGEQRGDWMNNGVDIRTSAGEPVRASRDGKVVFADYLSGYAYTAILDHEDGYFTVYSQNAKLLVNVGDTIKQGAPIAQAGENGRLAFLHFEIRKNSNSVNPLYYLP